MSTNGVDHTGQHGIDMPGTSRNQPRHILNGTSADYNEICSLLYKATISGNMIAARVILSERPELVRFSITERYETVLHIAILVESLALVEYLASLMSKDDLEIRNINGETALHKAALTGNIDIARILVRGNNNLLDINGISKVNTISRASQYNKPTAAQLNNKQQRNRQHVMKSCNSF